MVREGGVCLRTVQDKGDHVGHPIEVNRGAYGVYQQLKKEANLAKIKHALYMPFGTDESIAWRQTKQFLADHLHRKLKEK